MDYNVVLKKIRLTVLVACLVTVLALIFAVGLYIYIDYVNPQVSAKIISLFVVGMAVVFFITVNAVSLINKRNSAYSAPRRRFRRKGADSAKSEDDYAF